MTDNVPKIQEEMDVFPRQIREDIFPRQIREDVFPRLIREKQEESLSPYAIKSKDSRGRVFPAEKCKVRTEFERDTGRILYSMEFRRLRHKTQVFFNPQNDHICTRMEHVLYVNYISNTIARSLNLNPDLVNAISLGHDIGHSPFGHSGERMLDVCIKKVEPDLRFSHELHSLRVADRLAFKRSSQDQHGFNLTFEVRDGIVCHCGEIYEEVILKPDRNNTTGSITDLMDVNGRKDNSGMPATLEGCVMRIADKIAYVGRDIEDAIRAGIMDFEDIPLEIKSELGKTNSEIINTLVMDIIMNSMDKDMIMLSKDKGIAMQNLLKENEERIYKSDKIQAYEKMAKNTVEGLFDALIVAIEDIEKLQSSDTKVFNNFYNFISERAYDDKDRNAQKVVDFIAGMTDSYAQKCYEEIYWF
ncbi:MAG: HD domain-containing protein [Saccharofermentanales bacterium]